MENQSPKPPWHLLAACLGGGLQHVAPSVGAESAVSTRPRNSTIILDCHRRRGDNGNGRPQLLNIQAWRPGDGLTVARAMGQVLRKKSPVWGDDEDEPVESTYVFTLDLFHSSVTSATSGGFLSNVGRRRRSGGGVLDANDRWMTETARRPGENHSAHAFVGHGGPRRAKRHRPHISLAFDIFEARPEATTDQRIQYRDARPLHVFRPFKSNGASGRTHR